MITESPNTSPQAGHARVSTCNSSLPFSCARCNARQDKDSRNLVVCIDGTSNQFGQNHTNVMKLFDMVDLETTSPRQYAYYSSGIGARPKSSNILGRMKEAISDNFDKAVAWNIDKNVKEAYCWLAGKYQEGDQIYFFGFSRGAYQVRVLAGMIHEVGLIRTSTKKQIAAAYNHYEAIRPGNPEARQIAREFKKSFSWKDLRVHFIGVWDTVSSVGLTRGNVPLSIPSSVCHIRHALALDERRVKFMPEYFHEMNSQTYDGKSKYVTPLGEHVATPASKRPESTSIMSDNATSHSGTKENKMIDVKEVWFAGSHSDVGGKDVTGKFHQVGNVSLLWMRREAIAHGLVLQPTDVVWMPEDVDLGVSNSMSPAWRAIEYLAIKHRVSFSGAGDDAWRMHQLEPRHIMPGQKVHASILYANAYKPQATLGEGFNIPIEPEDTELDNTIWEMGLFDDTAAQELVAHLGGQQEIALISLDRLLFMLRFNEGKQCVRNVPNWQEKFEKLIDNSDCAPLVKLVTIVAYYEASCDPQAHPQSPAVPRIKPSTGAFDDAKKCLIDILAKHKHRDGPRTVALLRPLTKHSDLREHVLIHVLDTFLNLLDKIIGQPGVIFVQAMDGLNCLLQCADTRKTIIQKLGTNYPDSSVSRLARILEVDEASHLTAALRMVLTLVRIPEAATARAMCSAVKPRMREMARKHSRIIGPLAVEILLTLYNPEVHEQGRLNLCDAKVRENFASALVRMNFAAHDSAERRGCCKELSLRYVFALDATELREEKKTLIKELKKTIQKGNPRGRTAATMTLLKLCEAPVIRKYIHEIKLLDVLIDQLQRKNTAPLAAYALATCLEYDDMKESMKHSELLPKYIVGMLQQDYFDDAVDKVEGFEIFGDLMRHDSLRKKVKDYKITELLETKLGKGNLKEIRTSLIYLDIFRTFDKGCTLTDDLVKKGLKHLQNPVWKVQKAGVTILSALAQTEYGVKAIIPCIRHIIKILLPESDLPIQLTAPRATQSATEPTDTQSFSPLNVPSRPPSWMMGPACALRNLAQNKILRDCIRKSIEYGSLKSLYLSAMLIQEKSTSPWRVKTPDRIDVIDMLDKMIKAVDKELLSEEDLMTIGDALPPHIQHWNRLVALLRDRAMVTIIPALLGVPVAAILVAVSPIYLSVQAYELFQQLLSRYRNKRALDSLCYSETKHSVEIDLDLHEGEDTPYWPDGGC